MNTDTTRKQKHIDKSIVYLFSVLSVIAVLTLGYKKMTYYPCENIECEIVSSNHANVFQVGNAVRFTDHSVGAMRWEWSFGDSSEVSNKQEVFHNYKWPGKYKVKLRVNNSCVYEEQILVLDSMPIVDSSLFPVFTIPDYIYLDETLTAQDRTQGAKSWEWKFGENIWDISNKKNATYNYKTTGTKIVRLVVNGEEDYVTYKEIEVLARDINIDLTDQAERPGEGGFQRPIDEGIGKKPKGFDKPQEEPKVEKLYEDISKAKFIFELESMASTESGLDKILENMCGNGNTMITVNKGKRMSLDAFYYRVKGKKINVKSLTFVKDMKTKCITTFRVKYRVVLLHLQK